jgi:hypothetical protein
MTSKPKQIKKRDQQGEPLQYCILRRSSSRRNVAEPEARTRDLSGARMKTVGCCHPDRHQFPETNKIDATTKECNDLR